MNIRGFHTITREVQGETYTLTVHDELQRTTDQGYLATATIQSTKNPTILRFTDVANKILKNIDTISATRSTVTGTVALSIKEATAIIQLEAGVAGHL